MNSETGQLYSGMAIEEARKRGEPVVNVSDRVADIIRLGQLRQFEPIKDTSALDKLTERVAALEKERDTAKRIKALGLIIPKEG